MAEKFRVQFVAGVTPDTWVRGWQRRFPVDPLEVSPVADDEQTTGLRDGSASMCFVRLPIDRDGLHVIPLYTEVPVAMVAKEHPAAAFDELAVADLAEEPLLQPPDAVPEWRDLAGADLIERANALPPMTTKQAIEVVATGTGVVVVPMSVARLHHRKDVVSRPVTGVEPSQVGLAWRVDDDDPRIETFIGVVRGRSERSTRGASRAVESAADQAHSGKGASSKAGSNRAAPGGSNREAPRGRAGAKNTKRSGGAGQRGGTSRGRKRK